MSHGRVSVRMMSHEHGKYESEWSKCEKKSKESVRIVTIWGGQVVLQDIDHPT